MKKDHGTCPICEGKVIEKLQPYNTWVDGNLIVIRDVPMRICQQCGYSVKSYSTSEAIVEIIYRIMDNKLEPKEKIHVPIYEFKPEYGVNSERTVIVEVEGERHILKQLKDKTYQDHIVAPVRSRPTYISGTIEMAIKKYSKGKKVEFISDTEGILAPKPYEVRK